MSPPDRRETLPLDKTTTERIVAANGRHAQDTGSAEVQIALLTERIEGLTGHLQTFKQDNHRSEEHTSELQSH